MNEEDTTTTNTTKGAQPMQVESPGPAPTVHHAAPNHAAGLDLTHQAAQAMVEAAAMVAMAGQPAALATTTHQSAPPLLPEDRRSGDRDRDRGRRTSRPATPPRATASHEGVAKVRPCMPSNPSLTHVGTVAFTMEQQHLCWLVHSLLNVYQLISHTHTPSCMRRCAATAAPPRHRCGARRGGRSCATRAASTLKTTASTDP